MLAGRADPEQTAAFARRSRAAEGHFRTGLGGLTLSSIGLGTYLGEEDDATDRGFEGSAAVALATGVNVFDSALNYRGQRSERAIGRALSAAVASGTIRREEFFVSTKGGFLPSDSEDARDPRAYLKEEFFDPGILSAADVAAGCHAMNPKFLRAALERSRKNLQLQTIDLYYLHNPDMQVQAVPREEFRRRLRLAAEFLEEAAGSGQIAAWGIATWDALRAPPNHPAHLSLSEVVSIARETGGERHHFAAVQAPLNLSMAQALAYSSQRLDGRALPLFPALRELGLAGFSSASLLQGRLAAADLPEEIDSLFADIPAGARRALQFPRSAEGMTSALVGVSTAEHARETFSLSQFSPASSEDIRALFA